MMNQNKGGKVGENGRVSNALSLIDRASLYNKDTCSHGSCKIEH